MHEKGLFSKTFLITSAVVVGSGTAIMVMQQYLMSRREQLLVSEISSLKQRISKLEKEVKIVMEAVAAPPSSDDIDDVFVDASDITQDSFCGNDQEAALTTVDEGDGLLELLSKQDLLLDQGDSLSVLNAYQTLSRLSNEQGENAEILWRLGRAAFLLASDDYMKHPDDHMEDQKELMGKAQAAVEKAVEMDPENGDAHKWFAVIYGSICQLLPISDQIKSAYIIKDHIDAAIRCKPVDALSHHMLGRWSYSVYMLSWMERKVAATLFGQPPKATLEEVMESLLKAEELAPHELIDNALFLAKAFISKGDYQTAVTWLKSGNEMEASTSDDMKTKKEIQDLLQQYKSYAPR